jgi:hypothetical protein
MPNLNATIEALASEFARNILQALRGASLSDLTEIGSGPSPSRRLPAPKAGKKGRTPRLGWPKCKTCGKNAHPRGKGYCWEHALAAGVVTGNGRTNKPAKRKARAAKKK